MICLINSGTRGQYTDLKAEIKGLHKLQTGDKLKEKPMALIGCRRMYFPGMVRVQASGEEIQYKLLLTALLYPMMKHFYPYGSAPLHVTVSTYRASRAQ